MAFNGTGTFNRIYSWVTDAANGILVRADRMDTDTNDIAAGLSNCMTRDGQSPPTAAIPMGGQKLTGLANGAAAQDATTVLQVFTSPTFTTPTLTSPTITSLTASGTTTITGAFAISAATGTVDYSGVTSFLVPTATAGDNTTKAATTAFVQSTAFGTALPNQTSNANKTVITNGSTASWKYAPDASVITSNPSPAVAGTPYYCNTTSAAFTVTLPAAPAANDIVLIADYAGTFATNNLTIGRAGNKIMGLAEDMTVSTNNVSFMLKYIDSTQGWRIS